MNDDQQGLESRVRDALREVIDPELGLNVVDLGLVYGVVVSGGEVDVALTMTTPACPLGEQIARDAETRVRALGGITRATVTLVWDPPWGPERMTDEAKSVLGW